MNIGNNEVWRAIDGYLNYEVSSHGRVRNNLTGFIIKQRNEKYGYYRVNLYKNGIGTTYRIHRLVCAAFNENQNDYTMVDHIDRNRTNNFYENLRWVSAEGNQKNRTMAKNNTSGTQGVGRCRNNWRARWSQDGKVYSKTFTNKEDAINYRKEMEALHGYL